MGRIRGPHEAGFVGWMSVKDPDGLFGTPLGPVPMSLVSRGRSGRRMGDVRLGMPDSHSQGGSLMKRVLIGAIACLALVSVEAEDCSGLASGPSAERSALIVSVSSNTSTGQAGSRKINTYQIQGRQALDQIDVKQLGSGDNPFPVPTQPAPPVGCILVPPTDNRAKLTLKGFDKDTGMRISKTDPTLIVFDRDEPPPKIIINSSAAFAAGKVLTITWF